MIFASLGTMDMPFERMAQAVDALAASRQERVVVQTGYTPFHYRHADAFDFCTKDEMQRYLDEADVVVLQGGWGAISEAMEKRKKIVVMPRRDKTEHIHDQFQLVRKLDALGCVIGVFDADDLLSAVDRAQTFPFQQMERGNAEGLIRLALKDWFRPSDEHSLI